MAMPEMVPVDSSNVMQIGYDAATQELYVEYIGGRTYVYSEVPESVHGELMSADSKGSYLNREVKPHYPCRDL